MTKKERGKRNESKSLGTVEREKANQKRKEGYSVSNDAKGVT